MLFLNCVCHAFASTHCCLVVTCCKRTDLLALVCVVKCVVVTFPFGILGQVWYMIVSIPVLFPLSYFHTVRIVLHMSSVLAQLPGHRLHTN